MRQSIHESGPHTEVAMLPIGQRAVIIAKNLIRRDEGLVGYVRDNCRGLLSLPPLEDSRELQDTNSGDFFEICLNATETISKEWHDHMVSVAKISVAIAEEMGLEEQQIQNICRAALLHDIGKFDGQIRNLIKLDNELTSEQKIIVSLHSVIGAKVLWIFGIEDIVCEIVRRHHQRPDGRGYPIEYMSDELSLQAGIISLADSVDAIVNDRPGRPARSLNTAIEIAKKNSGTQFLSAIVEAFMRVAQSSPDVIR